jgi:hypothetical protein
MPVMTRVERSRRHTPRDSRWAKRRLRSTPDQLTLGAAGLADVPDGLDWDAFCGRYFSGTRRHDLEAASTYEAYTHGRRFEQQDGRPRGRGERLRGLPLSTSGATR